jgi:hypothetical protein
VFGVLVERGKYLALEYLKITKSREIEVTLDYSMLSELVMHVAYGQGDCQCSAGSGRREGDGIRIIRSG